MFYIIHLYVFMLYTSSVFDVSSFPSFFEKENTRYFVLESSAESHKLVGHFVLCFSFPVFNLQFTIKPQHVKTSFYLCTGKVDCQIR